MPAIIPAVGAAAGYYIGGTAAAAAGGYLVGTAISGGMSGSKPVQTSSSGAGYQWQDYWRQQDANTYAAAVRGERADAARTYYDELRTYRNQFTLRYGNTKPQELAEIDRMIQLAYNDANAKGKSATQGFGAYGYSNYFLPAPTFIQPTGGGILGDYAAINDKLVGIESDFATALTQHAQVRDASDSAFATKLNQSLSSLVGRLDSTNAQFKTSMNNALGTLSSKLNESSARQRAAVSTLRDQLAGSNAQANQALSTLKQKLNLSDQEARQAVETLRAGLDESTGQYKTGLAELKSGLSTNQAKYVDALTQSKELFSAAVSEARGALTKQEEFYASLIEDPGLASGQVRNLLLQSERDLKGQVQDIQDYYARIGRSGSGEEARAIETLRTDLARSFAENVAFTSDYGRQQSTAIALQKAGLSKEEADFGAQLAEAIQTADADRLKTLFSASAVTAQGLAENAKTMSAGQFSLAQLLGANASTQFGAEATVADLLGRNAEALFSGESLTNQLLSSNAGTLFSGQTSVADAIRASEASTAQSIFGAQGSVAQSILGAQTATAESNLAGSEFGAQLSQQTASLLQQLAGQKAQLGASLALPSPTGGAIQYNPVAYGQPAADKWEQPEGLDLEGLGSILALLAS